MLQSKILKYLFLIQDGKISVFWESPDSKKLKVVKIHGELASPMFTKANALWQWWEAEASYHDNQLVDFCILADRLNYLTDFFKTKFVYTQESSWSVSCIQIFLANTYPESFISLLNPNGDPIATQGKQIPLLKNRITLYCNLKYKDIQNNIDNGKTCDCENPFHEYFADVWERQQGRGHLSKRQ